MLRQRSLADPGCASVMDSALSLQEKVPGGVWFVLGFCFIFHFIAVVLSPTLPLYPQKAMQKSQHLEALASVLQIL